jgi:hypothetical protein
MPANGRAEKSEQCLHRPVKLEMNKKVGKQKEDCVPGGRIRICSHKARPTVNHERKKLHVQNYHFSLDRSDEEIKTTSVAAMY